jgi:hypothetical protein
VVAEIIAETLQTAGVKHWQECPGTGEGESALVAVSSSSVEMRCVSASVSIKLPRISVFRRRCHGQAEITQLAEAVVVPLARYFTVVGSVLTALLLIAGWSLPEAPASFRDRPEIIERAVIRITSDHKWPEKIVLDTSQPTFSPLPIDVAPTQQPVESRPDEMAYQTTVDAVAKPDPDARPIDARRRPARSRRKRKAAPSTHVARVRIRRKQVTLATGDNCCWSERADKPAMLKAGSRKRVARRDPWIGWHFPEAN